MVKPNSNFELSVKDVETIENCLNREINRLSQQKLTHIESTIVPEDQLDSVKNIDANIKHIHRLLGKLHNQKNWYRPSKKVYVSG